MSFLHDILDKYRTIADSYSSERITRKICSDVAKQCELKKLTKKQEEEIQGYWKPLVHKRVDTRMHEVMLSLTGVFRPEFEPFEICREVQQRSMTFGAMRFFDDKNLYRSLLNGFNIPARVAEYNNGVCYLPEEGEAELPKKTMLERLQNIEDCIIKPSVGTSGGSGVCSFDVVNGVEINSNQPVEKVLDGYGRNFCVERKVHECDNLLQLNPTSCNTLRVHTMRNREKQKICLLSSYVRIGKLGAVVDNMHHGGTGARIYEGGILRNAVACYPYKTFCQTESGVILDGYKIDDYEKIIETCLRAHSSLPMFDLMGWDVAVDIEGKVIIIEYNPNPDVRIEQAIIGDTCLLENQEWVMKQYYK